MANNHLHRPYHPHDEHGSHEHQGHSHDYKSLGRKRLLWAMGVTLLVMVVEIVGGVIANSIALLSDAAHMFTHAFALLISYVAIRLAAMEPCHHRTFGFYRAEVLASLLNGIFLVVVTGFIVWESVERLLAPREVASMEMFLVASIGLVVNLVTMLLLRRAQKGDRNIRSAFLHVIADALSSVAVVAGAVIIHYTRLFFVDPVLGMLISILILVWTWTLIKDSVRVLLEVAPKGMETDRIKELLRENDERILDVVDMHVVEITGGFYDLSAMIAVSTDSLQEAGDVITKANKLLAERYRIYHTTIQPVARSSSPPPEAGEGALAETS